LSFDSEILLVAGRSLYVSGLATVLASAVGVPAGTVLGLRDFHGRRFLRSFLHALYGVPPVLLGLCLYLLLSKTGPLGGFGWLFTIEGMILAQFLLVLPFVTGLTMNAIQELDAALKDTARTLGARRGSYVRILVREARSGVLSAVMVGFGRAISEVGAVIMVGGNIRHETEVLTTAIVKETSRGNFTAATGLGLFLLGTSALVFLALTVLQERTE
jgi:tungstate transport system permease protein